MAISKKRAPAVEDPQLNRVITQLYDDMNEIINAVNQGSTSEEKSGYEGKSGDIRLSKQPDNSYEIEGRTDEGWASTSLTFSEKESKRASIATMVDETGGTSNKTIASSGGTWDNAEINNAIASLLSKINEILNALDIKQIIKKT
mgnify:CR=1 FL=1